MLEAECGNVCIDKFNQGPEVFTKNYSQTTGILLSVLDGKTHILGVRSEDPKVIRKFTALGVAAKTNTWSTESTFGWWPLLDTGTGCRIIPNALRVILSH